MYVCRVMCHVSCAIPHTMQCTAYVVCSTRCLAPDVRSRALLHEWQNMPRIISHATCNLLRVAVRPVRLLRVWISEGLTQADS